MILENLVLFLSELCESELFQCVEINSIILTVNDLSLYVLHIFIPSVNILQNNLMSSYIISFPLFYYCGFKTYILNPL